MATTKGSVIPLEELELLELLELELEDELELLEDELEPELDEELELLLEEDELLDEVVLPVQPTSAADARAAISQLESWFHFMFVIGAFQKGLRVPKRVEGD
jgi:hypothetical protein